MGASNIDGPSYTYGNMGALGSAFASNTAVADPNQDAGPNAMFQGEGVLDPRFWFNKDQVQGYTGKTPVHYNQLGLRSINQIPAALGAANIAAAANAVSGTAMTLAAASVGVTPNVPIQPFNVGGITAGAVVTAALVLDFGFAFGNVTSGSTSIVVANSNDFVVGMPLVIAGVGNSGGTIPLLTNVLSITDTTHIVVANTPLATLNPAAIGTGNIWGPTVAMTSPANMTPTAALPWLAGGPGLFLDPRQAISRGVRVVGVSGGTGGTFTVRGWDTYWQPHSEIVTVGAGAVTGWSVTTFKGIASVTPNFSDAHNYSVGTSDVFGFNYRVGLWEDTEVSWNATAMTSSTGFVAALSSITTPTGTTADVRGTIQTSASGGASGIGATASNGTVSSLAMSGVRLMMQQCVPSNQALFAFPANATSMFGATQFTS